MRVSAVAAAVGVAGTLLAAPAVGDGRRTADARLRLVPLASGFQEPVYVAATRADPTRLYVVERRGLVRVVAGGRVRERPFLDVHSRVRSGGLLGLLSLAFDPEYGRNGRFYVAYTGRHGNVYVVRFRARGGTAVRSSAEVLLRVRSSPSLYAHVGVHLAFGPDRRLYAGFGDGGDGAAAQDLSSPLGKILRIDVDRREVPAEVVAYGVRNPWRFSFDRRSGDLYVADVGADSWEEVNYLPRGFVRPANLGWNAYEGRRRRATPPPSGDEKLVFPIAAYPHRGRGCRAIVGGYVYRGSAIPALRGRYVFGDLCLGAIWSLRVVRGRATRLRSEGLAVPRLLASFGEGVRGELYAMSLEGGVLYRLATR